MQGSSTHIWRFYMSPAPALHPPTHPPLCVRSTNRTTTAPPTPSPPARLQVSGSKRLVSRMAAPAPNPACMVCGMAQAGLAVNIHKMTLQQLVDKVCEGQQGGGALQLNGCSGCVQQSGRPWHMAAAEGPRPHPSAQLPTHGAATRPARPVPPCAWQVLKWRLALLAPSLSCGAFFYEEGEDLEEDEVGFQSPLPVLVLHGVFCLRLKGLAVRTGCLKALSCEPSTSSACWQGQAGGWGPPPAERRPAAPPPPLCCPAMSTCHPHPPLPPARSRCTARCCRARWRPCRAAAWRMAPSWKCRTMSSSSRRS